MKNKYTEYYEKEIKRVKSVIKIYKLKLEEQEQYLIKLKIYDL